MAGWVIDERFSTVSNAETLRYLRQTNPSAHSDVAEELVRAGAGVTGVRSYCPDPSRYAFAVLYLGDLTIIGLAFGMSGLAFRLPQARLAEALRDGDAVADELEPAWVRFQPWNNHETLGRSRQRLARWCAVAASSPDT